MDYQLQFRKFISSQYLYTGLRISAGVLIPAFILYQFGLLASMIALPLGALFISLTDSPGPINHRRNGMLVAILLGFVVLLIAVYSRGHPVIILIELILFGLIFTIIGVFGMRANSIGLTALIIYILNVDQPKTGNEWLLAAYFVTGGLWYTLLSLFLYTLRPYRPTQQFLGECLMEIADYLQTKKLFYDDDRNISSIYQQLMQYQVRIHNHFDQLRQLLYTTRKFLSESTATGRLLMMMFLESIDLMERIMTSQQDYELLHKEFDETGIIKKYSELINLLAKELKNIGLAVQSNVAYNPGPAMEETLEETTRFFLALREKKLTGENVEGFIRLRQLLYSLQDITERIRRLATYTTYDKRLSRQFRTDLKLDQFVSTEKINLRLVISNFSLRSAIFRHAARLVIALVTGYIVSLLFPLGHGYWILLTIGVILKPAYSITRQRNIHRLIGTFIGVALGFTTLYLVHQNGPLFIIMIVAMVIGYSFLKLNYAVSSACITLFVMLNFHFLSPMGIQPLLVDRIIDTAIGSVIAYMVSAFVLPTWEHEKIEEYILEALRTNRRYFNDVANAFVDVLPNGTEFRLARKEAFVSLANLSDNFQRMLSEPKSQQRHMESYHQFVAASHLLTSYIASLSYYAQRRTIQKAGEEFKTMIERVDKLFGGAIMLAEKKQQLEFDEAELPIPIEVSQLLQKRKNELASGNNRDSNLVRKRLSDLKTIVEQYQLVHSNLQEQIKILQEINGVRSLSSQTIEQN